MKSRSLLLLAAIISILFVGGIPILSGTPEAIADEPTPARGRTLERISPHELDASTIRRPLTAASGPIEVIVELEKNSLAAEQVNRQARGLKKLERGSERAYVQGLIADQSNLESRLTSLGASVLHRYQVAYNGLSVKVDASRLAQIKALPGVRAIHPVKKVYRDLDNSVPFIFGGQTHSDLGADGTGITIAIIDTGIDYTHAALGGSGNPADYDANNPTIIEPGSFPTAKVIGGTDLVGETYDAECLEPDPDCDDVPTPDPDPLDIEGHGTHVAGIAASIGAGDVAKGVAPAANLLAIKVFALGSTTDAIIVAAIEFALDPNDDGDTSDAADVINMSLGSPFGRATSPDAVAADMAAQLGAIVVASAGNSGNIPYITGSPATGSKVISVAAGNDPGVKLQFLEVANSNGADGDDYLVIEFPFAPALTQTGAKSGLTSFVGRACDNADGSNPFAPDSLAGMIPLIERGTCRFDEKIKNVEDAGAIAAVIYNNAPGGAPFGGSGDPIVTIPAVMVGNADGLAIRAAIDADTTFTLDPDNSMPIPNQLQDFTSSGPRFNDSSLKPDITAPGGSVHSAAVGTGTGAVGLSGTSMSAPHVAGVAALMRQLHPDWTVEEIKALLMNTATDASPNGVPYPVSLMGAGRVQVDVAVETESVVLPGSISFGVRQEDDSRPSLFGGKLTLVNKSSETKAFTLSSAFRDALDDEGSVTFTHPSTLTVGPGESRTFGVRASVDFAALEPEAAFEEYDGFLTLTETTAGGDVLRLPFHIIPIARADARAHRMGAQVKLTNKGVGDTLVDIYQLGQTDHAEDLIIEPPGFPNEFDNWFDVRYTGAHAFDAVLDPELPPFRIVEFGVATYGNRSAPNIMVTDVFIDADKDGVPDYLVEAADLGLFTTGSFDGRMVSAIFELTTGEGFLEFIISNERNASWQTLPFVLEDLNTLGAAHGAPMINADNPDFDYFVVTLDLSTDSFDDTRSARFNAISPQLDASPNFLLLESGDEVTIDATGTVEKGRLLFLFYNNLSGRNQSAIVTVKPGG